MAKIKKMIMNKRVFTVLFLSFMVMHLYCQKKDFGLWYNAVIKHDLTKKLEAELAATVRTFDNASKIEEGFIEGEIGYKIAKFLSAAVSYRITENIEDDDKYYVRHKWFVGLKGDIDIWDIELSGRARFQRRYKTYFEDEEDKIPDSHLRYKLKAVYKTPSFPLNPFAETEFFCPVIKESDVFIDKKRFAAGVDYKISKNHAVELKYIFQRDYEPKLNDDHIISLDYEFTF